MANVIWKPQPAQVRFLRRPEYEALYGGAAGGGQKGVLYVGLLGDGDSGCKAHFNTLLLSWKRGDGQPGPQPKRPGRAANPNVTKPARSRACVYLS